MKLTLWIFSLLLLIPNTAAAGRGDCGQPRSKGAIPTATDARSILEGATGQRDCHPAECDVDDNCRVTASDALMTLHAAIGIGRLDGCHNDCESPDPCVYAAAPTCGGDCALGYECRFAGTGSGDDSDFQRRDRDDDDWDDDSDDDDRDEDSDEDDRDDDRDEDSDDDRDKDRDEDSNDGHDEDCDADSDSDECDDDREDKDEDDDDDRGGECICVPRRWRVHHNVNDHDDGTHHDHYAGNNDHPTLNNDDHASDDDDNHATNDDDHDDAANDDHNGVDVDDDTANNNGVAADDNDDTRSKPSGGPSKRRQPLQRPAPATKIAR